MEGIVGALARITELQGRLSTLRPPAPSGGFDALLRQAPAPPARDASTASPTAPGPRAPNADPALLAAWSSAQRPASLAPARPPFDPAPSVALGAATAPSAAVAATYPNGQIPESALVSLGGRERLRADAAGGFLSMRAAAARDGIELPVNDSYRSLAEQEDMARRKGLYSEGGFAARPGTSTHGLGLSVDLQLDRDAQAWMRAHSERYGFAENVPREPWHWTYAPGKP